MGQFTLRVLRPFAATEFGADRLPRQRYAAAPILSINGGEAMRRLATCALLLLGCTLAIGGCARLNLFQRSAEPVALTQGPRVGSLAPDLEGVDFEGKRFKLSDYRGNVVVVSFWRSGCLPCLKLIPHEKALVQRYHEKRFVMLGVNFDANRDDEIKAIAACGVSWRNLQAGGEGNPIQKLWPVEYLPMLYVIDAKGVIRYARGSGADLEQAIDTLLAETESKR
jgi:thiol-disulfide isomerase/thioredoxin